MCATCLLFECRVPQLPEGRATEQGRRRAHKPRLTRYGYLYLRYGHSSFTKVKVWAFFSIEGIPLPSVWAFGPYIGMRYGPSAHTSYLGIGPSSLPLNTFVPRYGAAVADNIKTVRTKELSYQVSTTTNRVMMQLTHHSTVAAAADANDGLASADDDDAAAAEKAPGHFDSYSVRRPLPRWGVGRPTSSRSGA